MRALKVWSTFTILFAFQMFTPGPVPAQEKPTVQELTQKCIEFEEQFFGLSFEQVIKFKSLKVMSQSAKWYVSRDGNVAKKEIEFDSKASDSKGKKYGRIDLRSLDNDFAFGLTFPKFGPKKGLASQMTVDFLVDGFHQNAQQAFSLAPESMNIAHYIGQCDATIEFDKQFANGFVVLVCKHASLPDKRFVFDSGFRLKFVEFDSKSSNLFGNGFRNRSPRTLESKFRGATGRSVIGPIEYITHGDRQLVSKFKEKTTVGKAKKERNVEFKNYRYLNQDLSDVIEFDGVTLPTNESARRVSSQGEPSIRYEVKDGKIVKVLDSDALAAASAARQRNAKYGSTKWYAGLGLLLMLSIGVFVRSRGKSN